jgi:hypothetical protein
VVSEKNTKACLAMIINGSLRDFVCNVIAKGRITLGDVRRLQRWYLLGGIANREELEILISINAKLVRADKAWAQWLVAVVSDFITAREAFGPSFEDDAGKWIERLLAAFTTKLGRRIARQIRRELSRPRVMQIPWPEECMQSCEVQEPDPRDHHTDSSALGIDLRAERPLCNGGKSLARSRPPRIIPRAKALTDATHGWYLANYVRHVRRSDLINFQSSRVSLVLAPCL